MDWLKPEVIAMIIGVVGICEAVKSAGLKLPVVLVNFILSIGAGIATASPLTWQTASAMAIIIYGGSTLGYETIVKSFRTKDKFDRG